jgi:hypothetical protein
MLFDSSDPAPNILDRPRWWEATGRHCLAIVWARSWGAAGPDKDRGRWSRQTHNAARHRFKQRTHTRYS